MTAIVLGLSATYLLYLLNQKIVELNVHFIIEQVLRYPIFLTVAILLMPINWLIETVKWRLIICTFEKMPFLNAFKSVLLGVLLSVITPNRIGEIAGRLKHIQKENRVRGIHANVFSALSQLTITILVGLLALFYIDYPLINDFNHLKWLWLFALFITLIAFLYSNKLHYIVSRLAKKFKQDDALTTIPSLLRIKVLLLSLLRYIVFSFQFILLSIMLGSKSEILQLAAAVAIVFLFTAILPTNWASGLLVRTSLTFGVYETLFNEGSIGLLASVLLWMINLFLPAAIGLTIIPPMDWRKFKSLRSWK